MGTRWVAGIVAFGLLALPVPVFAADAEPERVKVQHFLIGFKRSVPNKKLDRTRSEAKRLANELLQRAQEGEDFDALVEEFTDDKYPGIFLLTNTGVTAIPGARKRSEMAARFGDVAFRLEVGEVGLAAHHAALSPFGWHIIKRLE